VRQALSMPQVGHLDKYFLGLMDETQSLLRYAFQTKNAHTIPVSGTGSASMESCFANLVESGDKVLIMQAGYFALRMKDMAERYGASVTSVPKAWGKSFTLAEITAAVEQHQPAILCLVHADTSTGAAQPMEGVGELCRKHKCLLLVDAVTSLGGMPLLVDDWGIDACYSGSQKNLSCPPGISPLTFSDRAMAKIAARKSKVANWYLDATFLQQYWSSARKYHHTAPISMNYGLREALRIIAEEGLVSRWNRHQRNAELLWQGLEKLGQLEASCLELLRVDAGRA
jgi:alanine-glyoxylate transaminase/serine-glyoxylate transaminase/serine-pyruvate transaminase